MINFQVGTYYLQVTINYFKIIVDKRIVRTYIIYRDEKMITIKIRGKTVKDSDCKKRTCEAVLLSLPGKHVRLIKKFYISPASSFKRKGYPTCGGLACPSENEILIKEDSVHPSVIIHEVGHLVYYHLVRPIIGYNKFWMRKFLEAKGYNFNWFGGNCLKNDREFFAEAYSYYHLRGKAYCKIDKEILDWLEEFERKEKNNGTRN